MAGGILHELISFCYSSHIQNLQSQIQEHDDQKLAVRSGTGGRLRKDWNVIVQPNSQSDQTTRYLFSYIFQVAISDYRIEKVEAGKVTFRYLKAVKHMGSSDDPGCDLIYPLLFTAHASDLVHERPIIRMTESECCGESR